MQVLDIADFNIDQLELPKITKEELQKQDKFSLYSFFFKNKSSGGPVLVSLPAVKLIEGGIYPFNEKTKKYYSTPQDPKRFFIQVPLDQSTPQGKKLYKFFNDLDAYFDSDEFRTLFFGNFASDYTYNALVRVPQTDPSGKYKPFQTMDNVKIKFDVRTSVDPPVITTNVYKAISRDSSELEEVDVSSFKNIEDNINRNAIVQIIICLNNIYFSKPVGRKKTITYGIKIKIVQLIIKDTGMISKEIKNAFLNVPGELYHFSKKQLPDSPEHRKQVIQPKKIKDSPENSDDESDDGSEEEYCSEEEDDE